MTVVGSSGIARTRAVIEGPDPPTAPRRRLYTAPRLGRPRSEHGPLPRELGGLELDDRGMALERRARPVPARKPPLRLGLVMGRALLMAPHGVMTIRPPPLHCATTLADPAERVGSASALRRAPPRDERAGRRDGRPLRERDV